jgi:pimeloyl-ACP methyl ester carboxylesterase
MNKYKFLSKFFVVLLFLSIFSSCDLFDDSENETETGDTYLVSYEMVKSYLPVMVETAFNTISDDYPQLEIIKNKVEHGVIVYKVNYKTSFQGQAKIASGLVCVPMSEGEFPVISYQNGTNTLHANAPSVNPDYELYLLLEFVASTGFIVSIPDYLGFGTTDDMYHPYLHKESTITVVTDLLRAVKEMTSGYLDINMGKDLYLAGYSQGGWATMQVQKAIEEKYSHEFSLKASACGAGPYDLSYINKYILGKTTYPMPYFVGYMLNSYQNLGEVTTPLNEIIQEPYSSKITTLYDGTKSGAEINAELTTTVADLFAADYIANFETDEKYTTLRSTLEENSISAWKTTTPTLLSYGTADEFVPPPVTTDIYQNFLMQGNTTDEVKLLPLPDLGHSSAIIPSGLAAIAWFIELAEGGE